MLVQIGDFVRVFDNEDEAWEYALQFDNTVAEMENDEAMDWLLSLSMDWLLSLS